MSFILAPLTGFLTYGLGNGYDPGPGPEPGPEPEPDPGTSGVRYVVTNISRQALPLIRLDDTPRQVLQPGQTVRSSQFDPGQLRNLQRLKLIKVTEEAE